MRLRGHAVRCHTNSMSKRVSFEVPTKGRGTYDITQDVQDAVTRAGADGGLAHVFVHHTSASVILCENADESVRRDLEAFIARLVPDGDRRVRAVIDLWGLKWPEAQ